MDILRPQGALEKTNCNTRWFYLIFLDIYLYIDYILVIRHPGDGQRGGRNMFVNNYNYNNNHKDRNVIKKETEKILKYKDLTKEIQRIRNVKT